MVLKLKRVIDKLEDVDAAFHDLYEEKDGKFHFAAVPLTENEQALTQARQDAAKFRTENVSLKASLQAFKDLDPNTVKQALVENESLKAELEALGSKDKQKFEEAVAARVKTERAPLERELQTLKSTNDTLVKENGEHKANGEKRAKHDAMREACVALKVAEPAYAGKWPDALKWAEENAVIGADGKVTDKETGLPLKDALKHMLEEGLQAHWWGTSSGGGGRGTQKDAPGVVNPWAKNSWNATQQGIIAAKDPSRAEALAKAAGVPVDAPFHPELGMPKHNLFD